MKGKLSLFVDYSMTGISATLKSYNYIIILCKKVDHAAFSFISPVNSNNSTVFHKITPKYFKK